MQLLFVTHPPSSPHYKHKAGKGKEKIATLCRIHAPPLPQHTHTCLLRGIILREDSHWEFYGDRLTAQWFLPTPPHLLHPQDSLTLPNDLMAAGAECSLTVYAWERRRRKRRRGRKKSQRVTGHRKLAGCTNLFHAALACVGGGFILLESNLVLMFTLSAKSYDYVEFFILIPLTNSFLIQV